MKSTTLNLAFTSLPPSFKKLSTSQGDTVLLDHAQAHHVAQVRELIEEAGAHVLYLPPYSPDLNPIELAWSKVKHFLRKAQARTIDALYQAIAEALQTISPHDARAFFHHVGFCV